MNARRQLGAGEPEPQRAAQGRGEPLLAAGFCTCLVALLAFDLQRHAPSQSGSPTAIVILIAVVAGWTLRPRWAAPVWALCAVACVVGVATASVLPIDDVAIVGGAVVAGIGGYAAGAAYRGSQVALDRLVTLIGRASAVVSGPAELSAALDEILQMTVDALAPRPGAAGAVLLALEDGGARRVSRAGRNLDPVAGFEGARSTRPAAPAELRSATTAITGGGGRTGLARVYALDGQWGVLAVERLRGQPFTRRELAFLRAIADLAGAAIDSRRRAADLERLRGRVRVTLDLAREMGSSAHPGDVPMAILGRAAEALDADRATLVRVRGAETQVVAVYDRGGGEPASSAGDRFPTELLLAQPTLREAMERLTPEIGGELDPAAAMERYRAEVARVRAVLAVPLVGDDGLVGLLTLSRRRHVPFDLDDVDTICQFRSLAVLALMHSWAQTELDRERRSGDEAARHFRVAVEAAKDVGFETELDRVIGRLLARSAQAVGADRGSIGRIDGDQLILEAEWPDAGEQGPGVRTLSLAGVPGLLETLRSGDCFQHTTTGADDALTRHGLQCPLMAGGSLVGVMALSREAGGPFVATELLGLQQLVTLTALTLRSARLLVQARALGVAKSEFLNMAAHELRTPLAIVRGYLSMMADGTLDVTETTRRRVVDVLCQKTDELSAMVDQILTAAQIQSSGVQLQRHVFDLRDAIDGALERSRLLAEQSGVELWCQALPDPVLVDAVQASAGRILDNLLANAITYGNHLPVRLTVEVGADVLVRIEDQGLGISPQQQARLFEPFFRVDQPAVQGQAGAGLGLAVSRQLAELSGGSLELEWTQEGAGSTFVLRLPAAVEPVGGEGDA